jgi:2-(1,2-epoxy-1,2-dihydrophenyl)acetyl-CoA isomerase
MFTSIIFEEREKAAYISLNRPEVFNALTPTLLNELKEAFDLANANPEIRVIVLSGGDCKAFSSGADLKSGLADPNLGAVLAKTYNPLVETMVALPKPIICHLNGLAAGAGMSLALACDMIIADENAYLSELFVGIGLMPDAGSMYFLPRLIGMQKAFELCATGRKVFMPEALNLGLVSHIYPTEKLQDAVNQLVSHFSNAATFSIGQMKKVLHQSLKSNLAEVLAMESEGQTACGYSADFSEGVMAFLQKRPTSFLGK